METNQTADNGLDDLFRDDVEIIGEAAPFAGGTEAETPHGTEDAQPAQDAPGQPEGIAEGAEQEQPAQPETKPNEAEHAPEGSGAETPAEEEPPAQERRQEEDLTRTQAFSRRLQEVTAPLQEQVAAQKEELEILRNALDRFGYRGQSQEIADQLIASVTGQTPAEVRTERETAQQEARRQLEREKETDPDMLQLKAELETLREQERQRTFAEDLAAVKKLNPAETAASIADLGETFARLRANGIPVDAAYLAIAGSRPKMPPAQPAAPPPAPGKVAPAPAAADQLYTREQVMAMTPAEVMRNLEKIEKSERTWK